MSVDLWLRISALGADASKQLERARNPARQRRVGRILARQVAGQLEAARDPAAHAVRIVMAAVEQALGESPGSEESQ